MNGVLVKLIILLVDLFINKKYPPPIINNIAAMIIDIYNILFNECGSILVDIIIGLLPAVVG